MNARELGHGLEAYSVTVLIFENSYLLLERAATKAFAPLRWTGVGGHVERDEFENLRASSLRELEEEAGLSEDDIADFALRRALLVAPIDGPLKLVVYCTARLRTWSQPNCPEGTLHWVTRPQLAALDVIEDTAQVLPLLFDDELRDPEGNETVQIGIGRHLPDGTCAPLLWQ